MVRLSVCIEMYWPDLPYEERIRRVSALGFPAFEFWGWQNKDVPGIKAAMAECDIPIAALVLEPGYSLVKRRFQNELVKGMRDTAAVARELGCPTLIATVGNVYDDESDQVTRRRLIRNVSALAGLAEDSGLKVVLEPLNTLVNHHGYWLTRMSQAVDIVQEVGSPSVKVLMDIYHQQITEGNIIANLTEYVDEIGHFHTAGVTGRHELLGSELDYGAIFRAIDATGYAGYVGLEYRPTMDTDASLRQALSLVQR